MTDGLMQDLRVRFRETTAARLLEMWPLLDALEQNPADASALLKLSRHFHALAGLGATYGYPRVSELGDEAESAIVPLVRNGEPPPRPLLARWRELVSTVAAALEAPGTATPPAVLDRVEARPRSFDVLIVEDDEELAELLGAALGAEGIITRICVTKACAILHLEERMPDAMIVDLMLPDGSGYDVVEALRERASSEEGAPAAGAGVIVISAANDFVDKLRAIRCGADAFVGKPLDVQALVRRVMTFRARKERPPRRVLAVEDDPTQALLIRRVLGNAGYEVAICSDPSRFDATLLDFSPDLLLMDVHLADTDVSGYELVRYVRQNENFAAMPVIFVTGDRERSAMLESTASGADLLVTKPVDWQLLLTQIASRLDRATALRDVAENDPLTGVLTRGAFVTRVTQRAENDRRAREGDAAFVLLDLDRFKEVNDTHGHAAGDRVLAAFGSLLRRSLRQRDMVGRYGGEEFALLLEGASVPDGVRLVERLLDEFAGMEHGSAGKVTFSAGVTALTRSFEATFRCADAALYEAKRSGRARVVGA